MRRDHEFSSSDRNLRSGRGPDRAALAERRRGEERHNIVIIGCSGHAKVVIDIVKTVGLYSIAGLIDTYKDQGTRFGGYEILGTEHDLPELMVKHSIEGGVVAIGDNWTRFRVTERVRAVAPNLFFPVIVHPSAQVASTAHVGQGGVILAGGIVNSDAQVGEFCIVSSKASLDHDSCMGRFASLMPGATVGLQLDLPWRQRDTQHYRRRAHDRGCRSRGGARHPQLCGGIRHAGARCAVTDGE